MSGVAGESNHTYIRNTNKTIVTGGDSEPVTVNLSTGLLGTPISSRHYKKDIKPMDNASEALFALKPVTFRYKEEIDQTQCLEYVLIAEDVAHVDPNLAIRDANGRIRSVRYSAISAMLLNEFLKEHRRVQGQEATITQLNKDFRRTVTQLTARLDEQAAQIQKVSTQLEASKPAPQVVNNQESRTNFTISRHASPRGGFLLCGRRLRLFESAHVLVRLDHVASVIVNANQPIM
jgi:hypothetical protein